LKECGNPDVVFKRFFKFKEVPKWRSDLQDILSYALEKDSLFEAGSNIDCLSIYLHLTRLIESAHLIDVREIHHIGGMMKRRIKERIAKREAPKSEIKRENEKKIEMLEVRLIEISRVSTKIEPLLGKAVFNLAHLDELLHEGDVKRKRIARSGLYRPLLRRGLR
jgi:hypothetical protein